MVLWSVTRSHHPILNHSTYLLTQRVRIHRDPVLPTLVEVPVVLAQIRGDLPLAPLVRHGGLAARGELLVKVLEVLGVLVGRGVVDADDLDGHGLVGRVGVVGDEVALLALVAELAGAAVDGGWRRAKRCEHRLGQEESTDELFNHCDN